MAGAPAEIRNELLPEYKTSVTVQCNSILIYTWPILFNLTTCLPSVLSTFLHFMLWFYTYFGFSMLVTKIDWLSVQMAAHYRTIPAKYPSSLFLPLKVINPINDAVFQYSIDHAVLCTFRCFIRIRKYKYLLHIHWFDIHCVVCP
jgi:hypothetical protein